MTNIEVINNQFENLKHVEKNISLDDNIGQKSGDRMDLPLSLKKIDLCVYLIKESSSSQKQGIVTCLPKLSKARHF